MSYHDESLCRRALPSLNRWRAIELEQNGKNVQINALKLQTKQLPWILTSLRKLANYDASHNFFMMAVEGKCDRKEATNQRF